MRLLNTQDLAFTESFDAEIPEYAILSHRWSRDEVSYKDFRKDRKKESIGYAKIVAFCREAARLEIPWGWLDTCCINMSSSVELSEAINSMFQWYEKAKDCLVRLADIVCASDPCDPESLPFTESDWFNRCWTLQELLLPREASFYDSNSHKIGSKSFSLNPLLARRTGINARILNGDEHCRENYVATKISWAANRKTSRIEDSAYCLMRLSDINMPLLYGKGEKAFTRLQEEIIRRSDDESVFAGTLPGTDLLSDYQSKLSHPYKTFLMWKNVTAIPLLPKSPSMHSTTGVLGTWKPRPGAAYTVTHKGIRMDIEYITCDAKTWFVPLKSLNWVVGAPYFMVIREWKDAHVRLDIRQC